MVKNIHNLTRFNPGSMREIWAISLPLIISHFSIQLMLVSDRIILAHWSLEAMNAAVAAGSMFTAIQLGLSSTSGISEVFVAQYNGGKQHELIGRSTWQMIWFSLMSGVILVPLTFILQDYSVPEILRTDGVPYFFWVMMGIMFYPLTSTLSAFYVGRGKTTMITLISIATNIVNIVADIILVFGIDGYLEPMGPKGAAIGTTISEAICTTALFFPFLNKENNKRFATRFFTLDKKLFIESLKIGGPFGASVFIEIFAWATIFHILALASYQHMIVMTISLNTLVFFIFFINGLSRGITTVAGNCIGSNQLHYIKKTIRSSLCIFCLFSLTYILFFLVLPDCIIGLHLPDSTPLELATLRPAILSALFWVFLYVTLDGISWAIGSILLAGGDSWFIFLATSLLIWVTAILPIYVTTVYFDADLVNSWRILCIHITTVLGLFIWRYKSGKWVKLHL